MKRLVIVLIFLLSLPNLSYAQFKIHNSPQGVSTVNSISEMPGFSGQCHWGENGITLMHTHGEWVNAPIWIELGDQTITVPIQIVIFHSDARVGIIDLFYHGYLGQKHYDNVVMDQPGPYVGSLSGPVTYTGKVHFNLKDFDRDGLGIPLHGWTNVNLFTRTGLPNGSQFDNEVAIPVFSMLDPSAPETPINTAEGIQIAIKCNGAFAHNQVESSIFSTHLTEFRTQDLPLYAPFSKPVTVPVFGYNYGHDPLLAAVDNGGIYTMMINPDLHKGVEGVKNNSLIEVKMPDGQFPNIDYLDPLMISKVTPVAGFAPGKARLSFDWERNTGKDGFINQYGKQEPGGIVLKSLANFTVTIGPDPIGCDSISCPDMPVINPVPPTPQPPIVCTPPSVLVGNSCVTPTPLPPVVGTIQVPVIGIQDTINGIPQPTGKICLGDVSNCKPF